MPFSLAAKYAIGLSSTPDDSFSKITRFFSRRESESRSGEEAYRRLYRMDDQMMRDSGLTRQDVLRQMEMHYRR